MQNESATTRAAACPSPSSAVRGQGAGRGTPHRRPNRGRWDGSRSQEMAKPPTLLVARQPAYEAARPLALEVAPVAPEGPLVSEVARPSAQEAAWPLASEVARPSAQEAAWPLALAAVGTGSGTGQIRSRHRDSGSGTTAGARSARATTPGTAPPSVPESARPSATGSTRPLEISAQNATRPLVLKVARASLVLAKR